MLNDWYIDRSKNFISDDFEELSKFLYDCCKEERFNTKELITEIKKHTNIELSSGNPNATFTRWRDHGFLTRDNKVSDSIIDYREEKINFEELVLDLFIKRPAKKTNSPDVKPVIIIFLVFNIMIEIGSDNDDIYLTYQECFDFLYTVNNYEEINYELIEKILDNRAKEFSNIIVEENKKNSKHDNEVINISIWFNALKRTPLFMADDLQNRISPNLKQKEFYKFISTRYDYLSQTPTKKTHQLYEYFCSRDNGFNEIVPYIEFTVDYIDDNDVKILYEYLFGFKKYHHFNYKVFFEKDYFGIFFPFLTIPGLALRKTSKNNPIISKKILNYARHQSEKYIKQFNNFSFVKGNYYPSSNEKGNKEILNNNENIEENLEFYDKKKFLEDVLIEETEYDKLTNLLYRKKNIIIHGSPGVGKTYIAKLLGYSIVGEKSDEKVETVQFHQSFSYENFINGYVPNGDGFELSNGVFYDFCKKAEKNLDKKYIFIIDEINRGNISKILGETLMLIEKDKRGSFVKLTNSKEKFSVPENVYIIGLMNVADRSIAFIDYALRRRFSFYQLNPLFDSSLFSDYLLNNNVNKNIVDLIIKNFTELNSFISDELKSGLGSQFVIGHSYFFDDKDAKKDINWYKDIIEYEIIPLLNEYWWDDIDVANNWGKRLLNEETY